MDTRGEILDKAVLRVVRIGQFGKSAGQQEEVRSFISYGMV